MARSDRATGGLVTHAHIGQREISNQGIIFRLFFEGSSSLRACVQLSWAAA